MEQIFDMAQKSLKGQTLNTITNQGGVVNAKVLSDIETIAANTIKDYPRAFALVNYSCGSQVGIVTVSTSLVKTLISNMEQFCIKLDNGEYVPCEQKVRKVFKKFALYPKTSYRYKSIFSNSTMTVINQNNHRINTLIAVGEEEIERFQKSLQYIDPACCTLSDLVAMARDMDIIGRALQELSIDSAKDKSKALNVDIMSIVNTSTKALSRKYNKRDFHNNITDVINGVYYNNVVIKYSTTVDGTLLEDVDYTNKAQLEKAIVMDIAGAMKRLIDKSITDTVNDKIVKLLDYSQKSVMQRTAESILTEITHIDKKTDANETQKIKRKIAVVKAAYIALRSITACYGKDGVSSSYIIELGKELRNSLYAQGKKYGFTEKETVELVIAAAYSNEKFQIKKKPSISELWNVLPKEYVATYIEKSEQEVKLALTVKETTFKIMVGDRIYFEDGYAETDLGDVIVEEDFTGFAVATEDGLIAEHDIYAHEEGHAIFLEEIAIDNESDISEGYIDVPNEKLEYKYNNNLSNEERFELENATKEEAIKIENRIKNADKITNKKLNDSFKLLALKDGKASVIGKVFAVNRDASKEIEVTDAVISNSGCGVIFIK